MIARLDLSLMERVFDRMGDVVFCTKDRDRRYMSVNRAFVARVNVSGKADLIGKTAKDFFPESLADGYHSQDQTVLENGQEVLDQLEQITNIDGSLGWYLASKFPVVDEQRQIVGLVGISQDLHTPSDRDLEMANLQNVVRQIRNTLEHPQRTDALAASVSLSAEQLDRRMKRVFRLSTKKFIMKSRLEEASRQLVQTNNSLADIASACGFADQSAFTKQFRVATRQTPLAYRKQNQRQ